MYPGLCSCLGRSRLFALWKASLESLWMPHRDLLSTQSALTQLLLELTTLRSMSRPPSCGLCSQKKKLRSRRMWLPHPVSELAGLSGPPHGPLPWPSTSSPLTPGTLHFLSLRKGRRQLKSPFCLFLLFLSLGTCD